MTQEEFYENIPKWISKPKKSWNHITLMALFCHEYRNKNGVNFRLVRWNGSPGLGKESRDFAKLFKTLAPENYDELGDEERKKTKLDLTVKISNYISWMFNYKFRSGEKSVTGTGLFLMPSMINEFERMYDSMLKKHNEKNKFKILAEWCKETHPSLASEHQIETTDDLEIIKRYIETYSLSPHEPEAALIGRAKQLGLIQ